MLMLLYIVLCIIPAYLMLLTALFNDFCLHNVFLPFMFANAFCFHALSWVSGTFHLFQILFFIMHSALLCWFS